jgi:protein-S-isoprenylcysteine O-methyltransferase Ste14
MSITQSPGPRPSRAGIPRWLALALAPLVWLVAVPAVHLGVPWALSHLGPRYGWADGAPAVGNLVGVAVIGVGAGLLVWCMLHGFSRCRDLPERVPVDWSPALLMTGGPYAVSRNPMYLGELALWLGSAVLYGSPVVLTGSVVVFVLMRRLAIREEASLEAAFGDAYRRYKARVPRWVRWPWRERTEAEPGAAADGGGRKTFRGS